MAPPPSSLRAGGRNEVVERNLGTPGRPRRNPKLRCLWWLRRKCEPGGRRLQSQPFAASVSATQSPRPTPNPLSCLTIILATSRVESSRVCKRPVPFTKSNISGPGLSSTYRLPAVPHRPDCPPQGARRKRSELLPALWIGSNADTHGRLASEQGAQRRRGPSSVDRQGWHTPPARLTRRP